MRQDARMAKTTHLLFDFFGTLVDYSPSWTEQGYPESHELVRSWGSDVDYERFLAEWVAATTGFDAQTEFDHREFSMDQVAEAFLTTVLSRPVYVGDVKSFVDVYTQEWNTAVVYLADTRRVIEVLSPEFTLAVVSNTHNAPLVPAHIEAMGLSQYIDVVITSADVGWRKPHPAIYAEALRALDIDASRALFVGDNHTADFLGPRSVGIPAIFLGKTRPDVDERDRISTLGLLPQALAARSQNVVQAP